MADSQRTGLTMAELRTWRRVISGFGRLTRALDRQLRDDTGLSLDDFGILSVLASTPGNTMRMAELADRLSFSPSRLSHAIERMERQGWVVRERSSNDRRGRVAHLTSHGDGILRAAWPEHAALIRHLVFDPLSAEQLEEFEAILSLISRATIAERGGDLPVDRNS